MQSFQNKVPSSQESTPLGVATHREHLAYVYQTGNFKKLFQAVRDQRGGRPVSVGPSPRGPLRLLHGYRIIHLVGYRPECTLFFTD